MTALTRIWLEFDSLDAPNPKSKAKVKKLINGLIEWRNYILEEMQNECERVATTTINTIKQIGWAREEERNPMWGSYGPAQGFGIDKVSALSGQVYVVDAVLEALYQLWPDLKPKTKEKKK